MQKLGRILALIWREREADVCVLCLSLFFSPLEQKPSSDSIVCVQSSVRSLGPTKKPATQSNESRAHLYFRCPDSDSHSFIRRFESSFVHLLRKRSENPSSARASRFEKRIVSEREKTARGERFAVERPP